MFVKGYTHSQSIRSSLPAQSQKWAINKSSPDDIYCCVECLCEKKMHECSNIIQDLLFRIVFQYPVSHTIIILTCLDTYVFVTNRFYILA